MSLLTEEQVLDLTASILKNTVTIVSPLWSIREWNDKQHPTQPLAQFEPDWSKYPKNAEYLALKEVWYDQSKNEIGFEIKLAYEKPITQHPHAALMAKYAEVAARRIDPWAEFEMRIGGSSEWVKCDMPISFQNYWEYRHIGETK